MVEQDGKVSILLVDDRPEKLLALEAVLEDLKQNVVRAYSGRDALRCVLQQEFAVILLDVNMPGMDGFETAALIRQRPSSQHVPIIFVTAMGEEIYQSRGYSLGAVDYIQTPVVPEVLKTKVAVFVELARKTEQIHRQAEWLRQRATQLHKLTAASMAINSALSMDRMLRTVTDSAREIIDAHQAHTTMLLDPNWSRAEVVSSLSDKYVRWRDEQRPLDEHGLQSLVVRMHKTMRMTHRELEEHPVWQGMSRGFRDFAPMRGWLAAPLTGRDGRNLGLIEVSDKTDGGDFTGDDEAILMQLAQMTSTAIENTLFAEEREANRIKDEFLATLSHELRTPLNAILGWTQLLSTEKLEGDVAHGLQVIERNARAQSKLIEDLLDVSRITTGKFRLNIRTVEFAPIVEAALDAVRPTADAKGLHLNTTLDAHGENVAADPDRMQQVVWNLLTNATKFTPPGGSITVELGRVGDHLRLRVSDTGQGISPKFLPHVFDRFRQADSTSTRTHGGLGIGLTVVRHIVEAHNGSVQADSAGEGQGASFIVTLPIAKAPLLPEQPRRQAPQAASASAAVDAATTLPPHVNRNGHPDLSGTTVLLIDDQPDAREIVIELLRRAGATVTAAASTDEGLECFPQCRPDVILSDIAMPGRDGYEFIRAIRDLPPDHGGQTPAIALTAFAREDDRIRALACGFQLHVPKPVEPVELLQAIATLARGRAPSLSMQT